MSEKDLLEMLDLGGAEPDAPAGEIVEGEALFAPVQRKASHASPTAFRIDQWSARRGRDLVQAHRKLIDRNVDEHAAADFHEAAFSPSPELLEGSADQVRHKYLETLLETPEYQALHQDTQLNEAASELATLAFAVSYCDLRDAEAEKDEEREKADRKGKPGKGKPGKDGGDGPEGPGMGAVMAAVAKGLKEAKEEVDDLADACAAMGMGPGSPGSNDPKRIAAMYRRIRSNPALKRIAELAGKYRRLAQSKQRLKTTHGVDDVVGVETGGEIARLLPVELGRLCLQDAELDALRRIAERQAQVREHRAVEPVGKGPIMLVIDESGSMAGEKVHTAKAIGLALAWVARQQHRWCALVAYAGGGSGERLLALPPGQWSEFHLMNWLSECIGGGSDLDVPVDHLPRMHAELKAPKGKTDVIFITDAICRIPRKVKESFLQWKQEAQATVTAMIIRSQPGDMADVSDHVYMVDSLSVEEEAVGEVLGL